MNKSNKTALSASRIKTLQNCSWMYWCKYKMRLPDPSNLGAQLGSIAHTIFECLGNPRHKKIYRKALKEKNIYKSEPLRRLVKKHFSKYEIKEVEEARKLNSMVIAGLAYDFFGKENGNPTKSLNELEFDIDIEEEDKSYRIKGFIDKLFLYKKKKTALIRDFKTSKKLFNGKEIEDNMQDYMYELAVRKLYPEFLKIKVEFPFLQIMPKKGDEAIIKMAEHSAEDREGFEYFLTEIQSAIDSFSEKDAKSNMASYKDFPKDGSFSGKLLCGFDQTEGQLKNDGTKRWGCPFKWPFEYYAVKDSNGKTLRTYFLNDFDKIEIDESSGEKIFLEKYDGCPAWNRENY